MCFCLLKICPNDDCEFATKSWTSSLMRAIDGWSQNGTCSKNHQKDHRQIKNKLAGILPGLLAVFMLNEVWRGTGLTPLWVLLSSANACAAATVRNSYIIRPNIMLHTTIKVCTFIEGVLILCVATVASLDCYMESQEPLDILSRHSQDAIHIFTMSITTLC